MDSFLSTPQNHFSQFDVYQMGVIDGLRTNDAISELASLQLMNLADLGEEDLDMVSFLMELDEEYPHRMLPRPKPKMIGLPEDPT